jgi:hypothetical protein
MSDDIKEWRSVECRDVRCQQRRAMNRAIRELQESDGQLSITLKRRNKQKEESYCEKKSDVEWAAAVWGLAEPRILERPLGPDEPGSWLAGPVPLPEAARLA